MRIIAIKTLREYWKIHHTAKEPLKHWVCVTKKARWNRFHDIRKSFHDADIFVTESGRTVIIFNVGGNNYRLVTAIKQHIVYILLIMDHKEYNKDTWKNKL